MRLLICLAASMFLVSCTRCSEPPAPATRTNTTTPAANAAPPVNAGLPTYALAGTASTYVYQDRMRQDLNEVEGEWNPGEGTLTVIMTRQPVLREAKAPRVRMVLRLKDKQGAISIENLDRVLLAFEDFPNRGNATMDGANTRAAVKSLSGGRKPGDKVTMEIDWTDTNTFKGRVEATIK